MLSYAPRRSATGCVADYRHSILLAIVLFLVNSLLVGAAAGDRSLGALAIAWLIGPIVNGATVLLSWLALLLYRPRLTGAPLAMYVVTSLLLPPVAVVADYFIIGSMELRNAC